MIISAIVAVAHNNIIGKDNEIPWYLPADFAYFKRVTLNHHIIMGRNCYESIGRPLPKRTNIVVTRNPFYIVSGCITVHSIAEGLQLAQQNGETEAFIIGGGEIYKQTMHLLDRVYLTQVDVNTEGDVFFPKLDPAEWRLVSEEKHTKDEKNEWDFTFQIYERNR
jgi:dihydrofolate reductase